MQKEKRNKKYSKPYTRAVWDRAYTRCKKLSNRFNIHKYYKLYKLPYFKNLLKYSKRFSKKNDMKIGINYKRSWSSGIYNTISYNKYIELIYKWFVSMNRFEKNLGNNSFSNHKLYLIQQNEISKDLSRLKEQLDTIKKILVSNIKLNLYLVLKIFFPLRNKILLARKLIIQKFNSLPDQHKFSEHFRMEDINSWSSMRRMTRIKYEAPKRYTLRRKVGRFLNRLKFNFDYKLLNYSKILIQKIILHNWGKRFSYTYKKRHFLYNVNFLNKSNTRYNIHRKIYNIRRRYILNARKTKLKLYKPEKYFYSLLNTAKFFKKDFFKFKKFYNICLSNLRFKSIADKNIKSRLGIKLRFSIILYYWRKLIRSNSVQYKHVLNRPIWKYLSNSIKNVRRRVDNRAKYLERKRNDMLLVVYLHDVILWRIFDDLD